MRTAESVSSGWTQVARLWKYVEPESFAAAPAMRISGLRASEANGDPSRCAYDCDGHAGHHLGWREHLLGSCAKGRFEGSARVRDVDREAAARRLGRIGLANPAAALVGVRKQVVLTAVGHREARLERPAQNLGAQIGRASCREGGKTED